MKKGRGKEQGTMYPKLSCDACWIVLRCSKKARPDTARLTRKPRRTRMRFRESSNVRLCSCTEDWSRHCWPSTPCSLVTDPNCARIFGWKQKSKLSHPMSCRTWCACQSLLTRGSAPLVLVPPRARRNGEGNVRSFCHLVGTPS